jgi:hypothetical protein
LPNRHYGFCVIARQRSCGGECFRNVTIPSMPTCFVIQPFDGAKFDKRYRDIFQPAIVAADLLPYRVDHDDHADVLIEAIEAGIREASVCLADITTDNPNVWFELGFAIATAIPVVMVCSTERQGVKFPFDIQHRHIVRYTPESPTDFKTLEETLTKRLKAAVSKGEVQRQLREIDPVAPVAGLSAIEVTVLAVTASEVGNPDSSTRLEYILKGATRSSLTKVGASLALKRLMDKQFVEVVSDYDSGDFAKITSAGWAWIDRNESKFTLRLPNEPKLNIPRPEEAEITDDDIPF